MNLSDGKKAAELFQEIISDKGLSSDEGIFATAVVVKAATDRIEQLEADNEELLGVLRVITSHSPGLLYYLMGDEWLMPNDPRLDEIGVNAAAG